MRIRLAVVFTVLVTVAIPSGLLAQADEGGDLPVVLQVGGSDGLPTISAAVAAAEPGATVIVHAGEYRESLRITTPITLEGRGWPVIDGGGEGHVIEVTADFHISGFVIRGSGIRVDSEDAGIMVRDASATVEGNRFEDVFYGIYLKNAPDSRIRSNRIEGKPLPRPRRGDGIRLWSSSGTRIENNRIVATRDLVVFFSDSLRVVDNHVTDGRYGLHYMYSHHNRFVRNRFERNEVGAFIMYSTDIELRDNVFAKASGMGLGLKDADDIVAEGNLFLGNEAAIYLDNSPLSRGSINTFARNLVLNNGVGVRLLPAVKNNVFVDNDFVDNRRPVEITGGSGGRGSQNEWRANHWSSYAGFDSDGDGFGDTPFQHARIADEWVARHPSLQIFAFSPAVQALDVLGRFFPLLRPQPVAIDSAPRVRPTGLERWQTAPPVLTAASQHARFSRAAGAAAWAGVGLLALGGLGSAFRTRFSRRSSRRRAATRTKETT